METSCGFSVSMISMSFFTSGRRDLGAATMRRLAILSGQILTERAPCVAGAGELLLEGEGGGEDSGLPGPPLDGKGELEEEDEDEDLLGRELELAGVGGAGCAFSI